MSGKRERSADLRARNRLILEARSAGRSWGEIAAKFRMTERNARRAAASASLAAEAGLADLDAARLLEDSIRAQARALYRCEELMLDEQAAVAVGACKAVVSIAESLRASLVSGGLLPPPAEAWLGRELDRAVRAFLRAAEKTGVDDDLLLAELEKEPAVAERIG